jgi:Tfp pilus assembly protein PilF
MRSRQIFARSRPPALGSGWSVLTLVLTWLLPVAPAWCHGAFHERLRELAAAVEQRPSDARLHFELATVFCQHEDWMLALGSADSADEFAPNAFPTDLLRGEARLGRNEPKAALAALDRFLATHPPSPRALVLRARAHTALGNSTAALTDYRAALRQAERPEIDHVREAAAALADQQQTAEAADILSRALAERGPDPSLLRQALDLEVALGRYRDALTRIDALQAGAPRPEPWMARRAQLLAQAGDSAAAHAAWKALQQHLDRLPNLERGSPALQMLAEQARAGLAATSS